MAIDSDGSRNFLRRQWVIGLLLVVIFVVSAAVGVVIASWPNCCQL
jgi:hypothetical protein